MQVYCVMDCWLGVRVLNVHFMYKSKNQEPAGFEAYFCGMYQLIYWDPTKYIDQFLYTLLSTLGVGVATCCGLDGPEIEITVVARFSAPVQTGSEA